MNLQDWATPTSASGAMAEAAMPVHVWLFRPIYGLRDIAGTAAQHLPLEGREVLLAPLQQTSPGLVSVDPKEATNTRSAIMELRRLSGLTWEQLATLFSVARRSLHFWASGKAVNAQNEERLHRVLASVRSADRGSAAGNRALLFQDRDGVVLFDLLARGEYEAFNNVVGAGHLRHEVRLAPLSREARDARKPFAPDELVGALQDAVHIKAGKVRLGRAVKVKRGAK